MKKNHTIYKNLAVLTATALFLGACSGAATPDAAAIATSAVQTVEARYTQQAAQAPTQTSSPTLEATLTVQAQATALPTMAPQTPDSNGKPCYAASVQDITIVDGTIEAPGSNFTKTWRLFNLGNCPWDSTYALTFDSGDAMGAITKIPLTTKVYPGASVDISVDLTAPTADGSYTGFWRMATPYGGTFGVGTYDQSIFVKITVSAQPRDAFGVSSVTYDYKRDPLAGCDSAGGMRYTVFATVTVNGPGVIYFHWDRHPYDGGPLDPGKLRFTEAGSKTVNWTWTLKSYSTHDIDRWIAFTVEQPTGSAGSYGRQLFHFSCP